MSHKIDITENNFFHCVKLCFYIIVYIYIYYIYKHNKNNDKVVRYYVNFTNPLSFQTRLPKQVDQHTGGKRLIHGTKHHKDNQLHSLELPCEDRVQR